jgi:hypothetical protein
MITAQRAIVLLGGVALAASASPAAAQVNETIVLNIMRECAKIDDPTARLACYDNNIRAVGGNPNSIPGQMARPNGGGAVLQGGNSAATGFGADDVVARSPQRFERGGLSGGPSEINAKVASVNERQPGIYLVTLQSGAQWLFTESGGSGYRAPRKGDSVELKRGALGSYLIVVNSQTPVRVTRVK